MADEDLSISQLDALADLALDDLMVVVDVTDTSMAGSGTDKRITAGQVLGLLSGDVTLSGGAVTVAKIGGAAIPAGLVKGDGATLAAAVAGTDYVIPSGSIAGSAGTISGSIAEGQVAGLVGDLAALSAAIDGKVDAAGAAAAAPVQTVAGRTGAVTLAASDVGLASVTDDAQTKAAIVPNTAPAAGKLLVGNGTAYAAQAISGSGATITLSAAGVLAVSAIANASLANSSISIAGTPTALGGSIALDAITGLSTTGLVKRTATNTLAIAAAGTDYQGPITLTTTGTSGAATLAGGILNIPQYGGGGAPGGADTYIQYNAAGVLAGSSAFTWNYAAGQLGVTSAANAGTLVQLVGTTAHGPSGGAGIVCCSNGGSLVNGDRLGYTLFGTSQSYTGNGCGIVAYADGSWSSTSFPSRFQFETAGAGSTTRTPRLTIDSSGNLTMPGGGKLQVMVASGQTGNLQEWQSSGGTALASVSVAGEVGAAGYSRAVVSKTSAYTATASDSAILANAASAAFTVTLPSAVGRSGRVYTVKKIDSSANAVTVASAGGTIDGASTQSLAAQWSSLTAASDGTNWFITSH